MMVALHTGELLAAAVLAGVLGYVLLTFLLASGSLPQRGLRPMLRSAMSETLWAAVVTFLLPLFFALGKRRGRGAQPIVLVHGYMQNRVDFMFLARFLERCGLGPIFGFNYFSFGDIRTNGERLARFLERVCRDTGAGAVDLVCHSMGGLVARHCIRLEPTRVRRCVTIASPHAGVGYRGPAVGPGARQLRAGTDFMMELSTTPLAVPMLSIYSRHDNVVVPVTTSSLAAWGGHDLAIENVGHLAILFDRRVAEATAAFLAADQKEQRASESVEGGTVTGPPAA